MGDTRLGRIVLLAGILLLAGSCSENVGPTTDLPDQEDPHENGPAPARIALVSGGGQVALVETELPQPLVVRVLDAQDQPVPGVQVGWSVLDEGGVITPGATLTDDSGKVAATWRLGTRAGNLSAVAVVQNIAPLYLRAVAQPGAPVLLSKSGGDGQAGEAGEALALPLMVTVADSFGNAVGGAQVHWNVLPGGGSIVPGTSVTNDVGLASAIWTIGATAGEFVVVASLAGGSEVSFNATSTIATGTGVCPARYHVDVGAERLSLPYCASAPLDVPNEKIERIVFSVHGISMNARSYLSHMVRSAEAVPGQLERTLIIAPQFMTAGFIEDKVVTPTDVYWASTSTAFWGSQLSSTTLPQSIRMSSFEIMDSLLTDLVRPEIFPNLEIIVVGGHSGGGQFANRFAAANGFENGELAARGIHVRYVVSNPSSYVYLNDERRVWGGEGFAVPAPEAIAECPGYDNYGYGLESPWAYLSDVGADRIRQQYGERDVVYLIGEADNDPDAGDLAKGCEAMMQGRHRLERGQTYFEYVQYYYGPGLGQRHRYDSVPGVGHSANGMWNSTQGRRHFFDYPVPSGG